MDVAESLEGAVLKVLLIAGSFSLLQCSSH